MSFSVYQVSIPGFINALESLKGILEKGRLHAENKKSDPANLLQSRLIADQFPLGKQIQVACDTAKLFVPRLTALTAPSNPDTESTFADYVARIESTIAFLKTVKPEDFEGYESKVISFPWNPNYVLNANEYVIQYAIPNFYFHVTTAYSILRNNGVELGKADYLSKVNWKPKEELVKV